MGIKLSRGSTSTVTFSTPQEIIINHADDSIKAYLRDADGAAITLGQDGSDGSVPVTLSVEQQTILSSQNTNLTAISSKLTDGFVNQVINADDMTWITTWSDLGTGQARPSSIAYSSASVGKIATKSFSYTLSNGFYYETGGSWVVTNI